MGEDKKKNSKLKTILSVVITLASVGLCVVLLVTTGALGILVDFVKNGFSFPDPYVPPLNLPKLDTPTNLSFDQFTGKITWDGNVLAVGYAVDVNGKQHQSETDSLVLNDFADQLAIKVQAKGDKQRYGDSDWSDTLSYTVVKEDETSFEYIQAYLLNLIAENNRFEKYNQLTNYKINRIHSYYIESDILVLNTSANLTHFSSINNNAPFRIQIAFKSDVKDIYSLKGLEILSIFATEYDIAPYDSAKHFIGSRSYDGEMKKYYEQGYVITVLDSMTTNYGEIVNKACDFNIFMNIKLEKDGITKYAFTYYEISVKNASTEKANYTTKVMDPTARGIRESDFQIHEGVNEAFMLDMLRYNGTLKS